MQEPRAEAASGPQRGELAIGFDKRLLGYVLSGMVIAKDCPGRRMEVAFVAADKNGVDIAAAGENLANEVGVGSLRKGFGERHISIDDCQSGFAAGISRILPR